MKILVVCAHPSEDSYNMAVRAAFYEGLTAAGHEYDELDLYKEKFDPVITASELKGELSDQIKGYQERIRQADCLAFIFPVWWYRCPAILEGWFDKVMTPHFAYKYKKGPFGIDVPVGLLPVKKGIVIETYGGPGWYYKLLRCTMPWKRLKLGVLNFCGLKKITHVPLYHAPFESDGVRKKFLVNVRRTAMKIK